MASIWSGGFDGAWELSKPHAPRARGHRNLRHLLIGFCWALALLFAPPSFGQAPELRRSLAQGWTFLEQAGNLRQAESSFQAAYDQAGGKDTAEVYYGMAAVWWERRNAMATWQWLHNAVLAARTSRTWDGGPEGEYDQRIASRLRFLEKNFTVIKLRAPPSGKPVAPLADPPSSDPVLKSFTDRIDTFVQEGVAADMAVLWLMLPNGTYWLGERLVTLEGGETDPARAASWDLERDGLKERKRTEDRKRAIAEGKSIAKAQLDATKAKKSQEDAAARAEEERQAEERRAEEERRRAEVARRDEERRRDDERRAEEARRAREEAARLAEEQKARKDEEVRAEQGRRAEAERLDAERLADEARGAAEQKRRDEAEAASRAQAEAKAQAVARAEAEARAQAEAQAAALARAEAAARAEAEAKERETRRQQEEASRREEESRRREEAARLAEDEGRRSAEQAEALERAEANRLAEDERRRQEEAERVREQAAREEAERRAEEEEIIRRAELDRQARIERAADETRRREEEESRLREADALRNEPAPELEAERPARKVVAVGDGASLKRQWSVRGGVGVATVGGKVDGASETRGSWVAGAELGYAPWLLPNKLGLGLSISYQNAPVSGCAFEQTRTHLVSAHVGPRLAVGLPKGADLLVEVSGHVGAGFGGSTHGERTACAEAAIAQAGEDARYGLDVGEGAQQARLSLSHLGWQGQSITAGPQLEVAVVGAPSTSRLGLGGGIFLRHDQIVPILPSEPRYYALDGVALATLSIGPVSSAASMARFQVGVRGWMLF